jgi:hypothetical protein
LASLIGFLTPVASVTRRVHVSVDQKVTTPNQKDHIGVVVRQEVLSTSDQSIVARAGKEDAPETAPTLPKSPVRPSMMAASHSAVPSNVRLEP